MLNLVKPHEFERNSARSALDLAIRGDLIEKHGVDDHQKSQLVVISKFAPNCDPDFIRHVDQLFSEYSVKHVPAANVDEFASQVEAEAHGQRVHKQHLLMASFRPSSVFFNRGSAFSGM